MQKANIDIFFQDTPLRSFCRFIQKISNSYHREAVVSKWVLFWSKK